MKNHITKKQVTQWRQKQQIKFRDGMMVQSIGGEQITSSNIQEEGFHIILSMLEELHSTPSTIHGRPFRKLQRAIECLGEYLEIEVDEIVEEIIEIRCKGLLPFVAPGGERGLPVKQKFSSLLAKVLMIGPSQGESNE